MLIEEQVRHEGDWSFNPPLYQCDAPLFSCCLSGAYASLAKIAGSMGLCFDRKTEDTLTRLKSGDLIVTSKVPSLNRRSSCWDPIFPRAN